MLVFHPFLRHVSPPCPLPLSLVFSLAELSPLFSGDFSSPGSHLLVSCMVLQSSDASAVSWLMPRGPVVWAGLLPPT